MLNNYREQRFQQRSYKCTMGIPPFKQITGAAGELADELTANNVLRRPIKNIPNVSITNHFSLISRLLKNYCML